MEKKSAIQKTILAAIALVLIAGAFLLRSKPGSLTLVNDTQESIIKATVEINHQKFDFTDIPPGQIRKMDFKVGTDNHYTISVEFRYERTLMPQTGYFSDRESSHQLVVKHDEVVMESGVD